MNKITGELLFKSVKAPSHRSFVLSTSTRLLDSISESRLPTQDEVFKFISLHGGVASLSFIKWVANKEDIEYLQASTLRIGPRQYQYLNALAKSGKLKRARFIISSMQRDMDTKARTNYAKEFCGIAERHKWDILTINNHSKLILMKTTQGFYVLETSSNLNDNPKIEQYSFSNDKELYDFYSHFFDLLFEGAKK